MPESYVRELERRVRQWRTCAFIMLLQMLAIAVIVVVWH